MAFADGTPVQSSGTQTSSGALSDSYTFSPAPTTGNHVFASFASYQNTGVATYTVTGITHGTNTYTRNVAANYSQGTSYWEDQAVIYSSKISNSSTSFNCSFYDGLGTPAILWNVCEWDGLDGTTWFDQSDTDSHGPSTDASCTCSAQNSTASGVAIAVATLDINDSTLNTTLSGYTQLAINNNGTSSSAVGGHIGYKKYTSLETTSAAWAHDNHATDWGLCAALGTYKAATGGGGLTASPSDTTTATDTVTGVTGAYSPATRFESVTATDTVTGVTGAYSPATISDTVTLAETIDTRVGIQAALLADTVTATDAVLAVSGAYAPATLADLVTLAEAVTVSGAYAPALIAEAVTATDVVINASTSEGLGPPLLAFVIDPQLS